MSYIEIDHYTKIIKNRTVLDDINLNFEEGKVYAIVGTNGSGKTMLLRAIAGLIRPTKGIVTVDGKRVGIDCSAPESMGLIIENIALWNHLTGIECLKLLASIKKTATVEDLCLAMSRLGLDPNDQRKYKQYSMGMKQKLSIAQAIMEKPRLLLLDEPTNSLDEGSVKLFTNIIKEEQGRGCTVLFTSHHREETEALADEILTIREGRCLKNA